MLTPFLVGSANSALTSGGFYFFPPVEEHFCAPVGVFTPVVDGFTKDGSSGWKEFEYYSCQS